MSVRQNLEYGLKNRNTPRKVIDERVAEAARILEIEPFLARRPRQLSGGQRQRVAMGRAIVRHPKAFLFDEPLSNLDAKLRGQMRIEIKKLQRTLKTTSVYVTHDQLEAMTLADRLVVMNAGRIEQSGTPIEVYEKPATLFVAGFIGSPPMNLIDRVSLPATGPKASVALPASADIVGIRPDAIGLTPSPTAISLPVTIELIEPVGAESHVYMRAGKDHLIAEVHGRPDVAEGATTVAYIDPAALHPFSKASGRRVE
jgi:sn-glycerol 3-phosphate transport system ATP-binding protein